MRLVNADVVKEALRNRISENIDECINNVPTVCDIEQIRAEIKNIRDNGNLSKKPYFYVNRCLQIIDKYRTESEVRDEKETC